MVDCRVNICTWLVVGDYLVCDEVILCSLVERPPADIRTQYLPAGLCVVPGDFLAIAVTAG